jgi:hypothetical protein
VRRKLARRLGLALDRRRRVACRGHRDADRFDRAMPAELDRARQRWDVTIPPMRPPQRVDHPLHARFARILERVAGKPAMIDTYGRPSRRRARRASSAPTRICLDELKSCGLGARATFVSEVGVPR